MASRGLRCPRCGSEEYFEITLEVDTSKAPNKELAEFLLKAVPFYKCRKCGETFVELADVIVACFTYFAIRDREN